MSRVSDPRDLKLPALLERKIKAIVHEHRMHWELWIETAESYGALKDVLYGRGYTNVPNFCTPLVEEVGVSKLVRGGGLEAPPTMIQKN